MLVDSTADDSTENSTSAHVDLTTVVSQLVQPSNQPQLKQPAFVCWFIVETTAVESTDNHTSAHVNSTGFFYRRIIDSTGPIISDVVTQEKMASPLDFKPSYPHYWSADSHDALSGAHFNSISSQLQVSLCAIPSLTTIPCISALGMPSIQPSRALRQRPPSCSYHLGRDPWSLTLTLISWQPILTRVMNSVQSQPMWSTTLPLNPGLARRLLSPRLPGISIS